MRTPGKVCEGYESCYCGEASGVEGCIMIPFEKRELFTLNRDKRKTVNPNIVFRANRQWGTAFSTAFVSIIFLFVNPLLRTVYFCI